LANELNAGDQRALPVQLDVTKQASTVAAFDAAEQSFGRVDAVIANAGAAPSGSALKTSVEAFDQTLAVNMRGVFLTATEGGRRMIAGGSPDRGNGRIIIVSSITARIVMGNAIYSATKAGIEQFGRVLAKEMVRKGVNVNMIAPGNIDTELSGGAFHTDVGQTFIQALPRQRLQQPESLDGLILYLLSDASNMVTGSVFSVDDGQSL